MFSNVSPQEIPRILRGQAPFAIVAGIAFVLQTTVDNLRRVSPLARLRLAQRLRDGVVIALGRTARAALLVREDELEILLGSAFV